MFTVLIGAHEHDTGPLTHIHTTYSITASTPRIQKEQYVAIQIIRLFSQPLKVITTPMCSMFHILIIQLVRRVSQSLKVIRLRLPREVERLEACRVLPIVLLNISIHISLEKTAVKKYGEQVRTTLGGTRVYTGVSSKECWYILAYAPRLSSQRLLITSPRLPPLFTYTPTFQGQKKHL